MYTLVNDTTKGHTMAGLATLLLSETQNRGWSMRDLASKSDLSSAALSKIVNNPDQVPDLRTLAALSVALSLPLRQLVEACGFPVERPGASADQDARALAIVSAVPEFRGWLEELASLTPDDRESVLVYVETLRRRQQQDVRG